MLISSFVVRKHHKSVILKAINTGTCSGLLCPSCSPVPIIFRLPPVLTVLVSLLSLTNQHQLTEIFCYRHILILPIIEHSHNPRNKHDFQILSNTRSRLRLSFSEFCSDTDLEVSKIIWNLGKWFTFPELISKQFQCHAS